MGGWRRGGGGWEEEDGGWVGNVNGNWSHQLVAGKMCKKFLSLLLHRAITVLEISDGPPGPLVRHSLGDVPAPALVLGDDEQQATSNSVRWNRSAHDGRLAPPTPMSFRISLAPSLSLAKTTMTGKSSLC